MGRVAYIYDGAGNSNYPMGVTDEDINRHFGATEPRCCGNCRHWGHLTVTDRDGKLVANFRTCTDDEGDVPWADGAVEYEEEYCCDFWRPM